MGVDRVKELENALRAAGGAIEDRFVKVGTNYYCHLTGNTISLSEYYQLKRQLNPPLSHDEQLRQRQRNKARAVADAADVRAGAR
ncbi:hypothetical protein [uncultured Ruegeria sp.]|uniref:hypothetical protein n=1 Tax=uncultured Ruegeria sp. TaxID=259304 RepID=UPI00261B40B2|nr:hypothetical protein [uncultured Ruegeria sp.]